MATEIICIVDTVNPDEWLGDTLYSVGDWCHNDSGKLYICTVEGTSALNGGPTGTSETITDGSVTWKYYHRDYSSIREAYYGEGGASPKCVTSNNLVANNEQLTIKCRASTGIADVPSDAIRITGWTVNDNCYVKIMADEGHRHNGIFDTAKYTITESPNDAWTFDLRQTCRFEGLQIALSVVNKMCFSIVALEANSRIHINNCILIHDPTINSNGNRGVHLNWSNTTGTIVYITNCLIYGFSPSWPNPGGIINNISSSNAVVHAVNNTIVNCGTGILARPWDYYRNNLLINNPRGDFVKANAEDPDPDVDYCISSDGTALGANSITNVKNIGLFADYTNRDLRPNKIDAIFVGAGTDVSSYTTQDIKGTSRPQRGSWDIGAFEYAIEETNGRNGSVGFTGFLSDGTFVREDQSTTVFVRHGFLVQQAGGEPPATPLLSQFSFRFRKDDGSESTATWEAAENATISLTPNTKIRLRIGIDATNDPPSKNFQIEYRHKPSGGVFSDWEKVT